MVKKRDTISEGWFIRIGAVDKAWLGLGLGFGFGLGIRLGIRVRVRVRVRDKG